MIYGFYFRFIKATHNKTLSIIFSRLARLVYLCIFQFKRLSIKRKTIQLSEQDARARIDAFYPDPHGRAEVSNPPIDDAIDLSIVVPIYNYVGLIEKNIESILHQKTQYHFEVILIDDGSTDGSRDVILRYQKHPNVKVILQDNHGIAGARNTGINHASGRYLMFVDCDDTVREDLVETLLNKAMSEDCDMVMCAHNLCKERDGQVYQIIPNIYPGKNLLGYKNGDEIMNYAGLPWCKVYKREMWNQVRFLPGYWYEDSIIQFLLFPQCKRFEYIPRVCYDYRWYENNFSHTQGDKSTNKKTIDRYWVLLGMLEKYEELGLPKDGQFYTLLLKHLSMYYYPTIAGMDKEIVEALFVLGCGLLRQYRPEGGCKLPYILRVTEKAMLSEDIELWKLVSMYQ